MKLLQILFVLMLVGFVFAAPTLCYQETANVSTVCGGLDTGAYGGNWIGSTYLNDSAMAYDGNWATPTYNFSDDVQNYLVINYTIPAGTLNAIWQVKWISGDNASETRNFTLGPQCDKSTGKYDVMLNVYPNQTAGYMAFACRMSSGTWNSSGMIDYGNPSNITNISIFEENMWWNISSLNTPVLYSPTNATYNYLPLLVNASCIGDAASWLMNVTFDGGLIDTNWPIANNTEDIIWLSAINGFHNITVTCANDTLGLTNTSAPLYFTMLGADLPSVISPTNTTYTSATSNTMSIRTNCTGTYEGYLFNITATNLSGPTGTHAIIINNYTTNDTLVTTTHFLQDNAYELTVTCANDTFLSTNSTDVFFTLDVNATRVYTESVYWNINRTTGNGTVSTPLLDSIFSGTGASLTTISTLLPLLTLALIGGITIFLMINHFGRNEA